MELIKGIIPAMLTPFDENQEINEPVIRQLVNHLLSGGVQGIFALGTNGEFFVLNDDEKVKVASIVIEEVKGRVPVIIGTGAVSTRETIRLSKRMEALGADCLSVITPYFNALTQKEVIYHYRALADSVSLPITMYNIPARTGVSLAPATVAELAKVPNIMGVKDSSGNYDNILQYIELTRDEHFGVYAGTDSLILWTLLAGGVGAVAATANMFPRLVVSIYENWLKGDMNAAKKAQAKLRAIRNAGSMGSLPSVFKAAVNLLGIPVGSPRLPVLPLTDQQIEQLKGILMLYES